MMVMGRQKFKLMFVLFIINMVLITHYFTGFIKLDTRDSEKISIDKESTSMNSLKEALYSRRNLFPESCSCKSLFTINACNITNPPFVAGKELTTTRWRKIYNQLQKYREGAPLSVIKIFNDLLRYIPTLYTVDIHKRDIRTYERNVINKTSPVNPSPKLNINDVNPVITPFNGGFVSCDVHTYSSSDVGKCTKRFQDITGQPLRIYFVGDSMIRSVMQAVVEQTHDELGLEFKGPFKLDLKEDFLNHKIKFNVPIAGIGCEFRFYWAPYLESKRNNNNLQFQGARDLLEIWANGTPQNLTKDPIPDILYLGGGFWEASTETGVDAIDNSYHQGHKLRSLLATISQKSRILWHFHPVIKYWAADLIDPKDTLEFMNQMNWLVLKQPRMWVWETLALISIKESKECETFKKSGLIDVIPEAWRCSDPQHPGQIARNSAVNLIWNLACNKILKFDKDMCCS